MIELRWRKVRIDCELPQIESINAKAEFLHLEYREMENVVNWVHKVWSEWKSVPIEGDE